MISNGSLSSSLIHEVEFLSLPVVGLSSGDVLKVWNDSMSQPIKEVYFSEIHYGAIKAWKKHTQNISRLCVPKGQVFFVVLDEVSKEIKTFKSGRSEFSLLTIPPGLWFGFKGIAQETSLILSLPDNVHRAEESESAHHAFFDFEWSAI